MMQYNFEQSKDVSYRLFGSYFVIPWTVKDPSRIHAEVKYPDGNMEELSPERDFKVDVDESSLILSSKRWINDNNALRIFEGEKQTFKDFNIEVQKKVNQVAVLTQKMNIIDGIVNDLATQTKDVGRKLEQIDLSKLEGLDPQTRKYLQDIQTQLTSDTLTLQHDDTMMTLEGMIHLYVSRIKMGH
ncbi:hypothetical protein [Candidatus Liberibacter asiaticus]|uniref:hypothetical protein n=1 Tax=Liberibacter asiaticus TaxID=34021 RepID=UPI001939095D|nr:hypothetical protein [Candidatus Liberibacter asiaticus]QOI69821.1 hypothetical protein [Liberibacter phage P-PA19-2]